MRAILEADVLMAARHLLGAHLVLGSMRARLVELEAYRTPDDPGCHAHRGQTPRNRAMFGPPGMAYIYFTYGNHWMLNVSAHKPGNAAAVLIRGAEPLEGLEEMFARRGPIAKHERDLLSGPGKLCQAFGIDAAYYGVDLLDPTSPLGLEPGSPVTRVLFGPRIGISQGNGDTVPWRMADTEALCWASKPHRGLLELNH